MSKSQQRKGRNGEIEICRIFQAHGIDAQPGDPVSFGNCPDITGVNGIHCEVKRCEQMRLTEWLEQATRDSERFHDGAPTIFHRRNRSPWLVTMRLEDWMTIYKNCRELPDIAAKGRGDNV